MAVYSAVWLRAALPAFNARKAISLMVLNVKPAFDPAFRAMARPPLAPPALQDLPSSITHAPALTPSALPVAHPLLIALNASTQSRATSAHAEFANQVTISITALAQPAHQLV